ncbi:TonB-dependent receptor, partial [Akkermansiaceae bacterium]|nr:TonB-dependent receptor [Akkermansiaceae bacterium]
GETFNSYDLSIDSFGATYAAFDYNHSSNDKTAFRFNVFQEHLENDRDFFDGDRVGINPTLTYELGEKSTLTLSYEYNNHERFIDRGIPTGDNGEPVSALANTVFGDSELNTTTLESHTFRATFDHEFSDNWKGSFSAFTGNYDKSYQNFYASDYDEATNLVTLDGYLDTTERTNTSFSGDLVGEIETGSVGHKIVIGGEYSRTSSDQDRYNSFFDTTSDDNEVFNASNFRLRNGVGVNAAGVVTTNSFNTDLNDDTRVDIDAFSFYIQDEIAVHEMLDVVLGARYDSFDIDVFNAVDGENRSRTDEEISPRFGLVFKPTQYLSFYGSYSESFLPRSGEQFANIDDGNDALDPNTYSNTEFGAKWDIKDDLSLTIAAFRIEESSPQVSDLDASLFTVIDTETQGVELELKGNVNHFWSVAAGYSYLDGEQVDSSGSDTGLTPREQPKHAFSVWNYAQATEKLAFGLGVIYQDESFIDNDNTATLPSYVRVDAAAYYQLTDNFKLQLNIENLLDRDYFPTSHSTHQVSVGSPISATLSLSGSF